MDAIPERPAIARSYRVLLDFGERYIPIPDVNPSLWSLAGLLACIACLYASDPAISFSLVLFSWITDWYDGATARRFGKLSREGYLIDDVIDRFSEAFIFLADASTSIIARGFFVLWIVNTILTIWSVANGKHRILPLRFLYLLVLGYWMVV